MRVGHMAKGDGEWRWGIRDEEIGEIGWGNEDGEMKMGDGGMDHMGGPEWTWGNGNTGVGMEEWG